MEKTAIRFRGGDTVVSVKDLSIIKTIKGFSNGDAGDHVLFTDNDGMHYDDFVNEYTLHVPFAVGDLVKSEKSSSIRKISRINYNSDFPVLFVDGGGCSLEEIVREYTLFVPEYDASKPIELKIVDMGPNIKIASSARFYVTIKGVDTPITDDFIDMCEELLDCDGGMVRFIFNNKELECALIATEMVFRNARGSYGCSNEFRTFYDTIIAEAGKVWDIKPDMTWKPTPQNIANLPQPVREYIESLQAQVKGK